EVGVVEAVAGVRPHPDGDATEGAPRPGAGDRAVVDRRHRRAAGGHHVHPLVCPATGTGRSPAIDERHRALHRARRSPARRRRRLGGRRRVARLVGAPAGGGGGGRRRRVVTAAGGRGGGRRRAGGGRRGEPRLLFSTPPLFLFPPPPLLFLAATLLDEHLVVLGGGDEGGLRLGGEGGQLLCHLLLFGPGVGQPLGLALQFGAGRLEVGDRGVFDARDPTHVLEPRRGAVVGAEQGHERHRGRGPDVHLHGELLHFRLGLLQPDLGALDRRSQVGDLVFELDLADVGV